MASGRGGGPGEALRLGRGQVGPDAADAIVATGGNVLIRLRFFVFLHSSYHLPPASIDDSDRNLLRLFSRDLQATNFGQVSFCAAAGSRKHHSHGLRTLSLVHRRSRPCRTRRTWRLSSAGAGEDLPNHCILGPSTWGPGRVRKCRSQNLPKGTLVDKVPGGHIGSGRHPAQIYHIVYQVSKPSTKGPRIVALPDPSRTPV